MIVIDASAFLEVLMRSTSGLAVEALLEDTMAPDLLDAEVFHRLVRAEQGGALQPTQLDERLALLYDAPIERIPCRELLITARRFVTAMSGYDALYAALAAGSENRKPLSPKTISYVHSTLHKVLADAVDAGLLGRNVAANAQPPRPARRSTGGINAWTESGLPVESAQP